MKRTLAILFGIACAVFGFAAQVEVATTVPTPNAFTEGPAVDAAGNVYFCETRANQIWKLGVDGKTTVYRAESNKANGLAFDPQFRLLAAETGIRGSNLPPRVTRTNIQTGAVEVLCDRYEGKRLNAPNDVTVDGKGRIYFTDQGGPNNTNPDVVGISGVYRIDPDGKVTRILATPEIDRPNGVIISPDDRTLYLVESNQAANGARMIRAYDLRPDGSVTNMRVFHNFYPGRSGDGMAIDTQGNLYVAAGLNKLRGTSETLDTKAGVHVFAPGGKLIEFIPIAEDTITNPGFGGPDMKTLYISAGKTIYQLRTEITGTRR